MKKLSCGPSSAAFAACVALVLLVVNGAIFFILNRYQPLSFDDYMYTMVFGRSADRVNSLGDIVESQMHHWLYANGRCAIHTIVQFFLMYDKAFFNIANTAVLILLSLLVARFLGKTGWKDNVAAGSFVLGLIVLLTPCQGAALLSVAAAFNSLWVFLFLIFFLSLAVSSGTKGRVLALITALYMGNLHEGVGIGVLGFMVLYCLLTVKKERSFLLYAIILLFAVGLVSNLLAPGTRLRMAAAGTHVGGFWAVFAVTLENAKRVFTDATVIKFTLPSLVLIVLSVTILALRRRHGLDRKNTFAICFLFAAFLQASAVCSGGASVLYDRAWAGVVLFSLLAFLVYFIPVLQSISPCRQLVCMLLVGVLSATLMAWAIPGARANARYSRHVIAQVRAGKPYAVEDYPDLSSIPVPFWWNGGITSNCTFYSNRFAATYHGVESISVLTSAKARILRKIPQNVLEQARKGDIVMLGKQDDIFLMLEKQSVLDIPASVCEYPPSSPDGEQRTASVWCDIVPMGEYLGVLIRPGITAQGCHIQGVLRQPNKNGNERTSGRFSIDFSAEQLEQLRRCRMLSAAQVKYLEK